MADPIPPQTDPNPKTAAPTQPVGVTPPVASTPKISDDHMAAAAAKPNFLAGAMSGANGKMIKFALIGLGVFTAIVFILGVLAVVFKAKIRLPLVALPTASPVPLPPVSTPTPSKYATQSAVIKIQEDINALDQDLNKVELDESNIKPKPLDFDVVFK